MVGTWRVRVGVVAVAAGALLGAAEVPASAWPLPLTSEDTSYLNAVRGNFPGDDDQLLIAISCRMSAAPVITPVHDIADTFVTHRR
jgi:hypothetical protein